MNARREKEKNTHIKPSNVIRIEKKKKTRSQIKHKHTTHKMYQNENNIKIAQKRSQLMLENNVYL